MIPEHVKHVYTGHYHQHNRLSNKATIIGSPMQLTRADAGDTRGFLVVDTGTGECKQIETDAPVFMTLDMDGRGSCDYIYPERVGPDSPYYHRPFRGNFVRVTNYNATYTEDIRKGLMEEAGARSVEFIPVVAEKKRLEPLGKDGFHLPSLVTEYEKQQEVTPERSQVGKEIMQ
jgi:DNA repair exonuclease SbcCD nuclease subunit